MLSTLVALMAQSFVMQPPREPAEPSPMVVEIVRDAMTDDIRAFATLRQGGDRLVISCDPARYRGARVEFHSRRWLQPGTFAWFDAPLRYRFDDNPPQQMMWYIRHRRAALYRERRAAAFIAEMMTSRRLAIRTRDVENHRFDTVFTLPETRPAIEQALSACGLSANG
jgi:hypothetical protein